MTVSWWSFPWSLLRGDTRSKTIINWRHIPFCCCYRMTAYYFTARKTIFSFSRRPEKMVYPKKLCWNMIFLVLSTKTMFLFPENMILPQEGKWKMIFLKKITREYIFFECSEKMVFSKRIVLGYDLSCTIWKRGIVFLKTWYFFPGWKMREMTFLKKYTETWYFLFTIFHVPPAKKIKYDLILQKYT